MKIKINKKRITLFKYFLSNLMIVVILLFIITGVIYGDFIKEYKETVIESNLLELKQMKDDLSTRIKEMKNMALQISDNSKLSPFMINKGGYSTYQAVSEFKQYKSINSFIYDVYLYSDFQDSKTISSDSGIFKVDSFFKNKFVLSESRKSEFESLLETAGQAGFQSEEIVGINKVQNTSILTYIYPLPGYGGTPYASVLFSIEGQTIKNMMKNVMKNYDAYIYILDKENRILTCSTGNYANFEPKKVLEYINLHTLNSSDIIKIENVEFSTLHIKSVDETLTYLMITPTKQFMNVVLERQRVLYISMLFLLLLGVALSLLFSFHHYKPIGEIVSYIEKNANDNDGTGSPNEISFISDSVEQLFKKNDGLMEKLYSATTARRYDDLLQLLEGKYSSISEAKKLVDIDRLDFKQLYYAVICILIDDYKVFKNENSLQMQNVLKYCIINCMEELSLKLGTGYGLQLPDSHSTIVLMNIGNMDLVMEMCEMCGEFREIFRENFGISLSFGISNIYYEIEEIPKAFEEAKYAASYRLFTGKSSITTYLECLAAGKSEYSYPVEIELNMVEAIKQSDIDKLTEVAAQFVSKVKSDITYQESARLLCSGIINTVMKTLMEMNVATDEELIRLTRTYFDIEFETLEEMEKQLFCLFEAACSYTNSKKEKAKLKLQEELIAYIEVNYSGLGFCIQSVAGYFNHSTSYIARYFKENMGQTLMHYVDDLRMRKAKQLLRETSLPLQDIMDAVGYIDKTNFIRKFKKAEGITPIQYRDLYQYRLKEILKT